MDDCKSIKINVYSPSKIKIPLISKRNTSSSFEIEKNLRKISIPIDEKFKGHVDPLISNVFSILL